MNKITPDHLSRGAYVYVRQSTSDQLTNNRRADDVNMHSLPVRELLAGRMSPSSTRTLGGPAAGYRGQGLSDYWPPSARERLEQSLQSKLHVSLVTAAIGTRCSSSAPS